MRTYTFIHSLKAISVRHIGTWLLNQMRQPDWLDNLVVSSALPIRSEWDCNQQG